LHIVGTIDGVGFTIKQIIFVDTYNIEKSLFEQVIRLYSAISPNMLYGFKSISYIARDQNCSVTNQRIFLCAQKRDIILLDSRHYSIQPGQKLFGSGN